MVFQTKPHIQRARGHIDSGDADRLFYACLELRYALERIAYQKLRLRLDKITIEESVRGSRAGPWTASWNWCASRATSARRRDSG